MYNVCNLYIDHILLKSAVTLIVLIVYVDCVHFDTRSNLHTSLILRNEDTLSGRVNQSLW